jgi:hypothetical protein
MSFPILIENLNDNSVPRILRKIAANKTDDLGDLSTLGEPEILQKIIEKNNSGQS